MVDEVAVSADAPGYKTRRFAEKDALAFLLEHLVDGQGFGRVFIVNKFFRCLEEPVVKLSQGDLVVKVLASEIAALLFGGQVQCIGLVVGEIELFRQLGGQVVEVFGGGVAQQDEQVGDASVVADFEVLLHCFVCELGANFL